MVGYCSGKLLQVQTNEASKMVVLRSVTAVAACAATFVDAAALLPRANSTKKLVTSVSISNNNNTGRLLS